MINNSISRKAKPHSEVFIFILIFIIIFIIIKLFLISIYVYYKFYNKSDKECYTRNSVNNNIDIPKNAFYKDYNDSYNNYKIIGGISGTNWVL
jgi:hypothetical protein